MGFRVNNDRTFAEYVELDIAVNAESPNSYLFNRQTSKLINQLVKELRIYVFPLYINVMGKLSLLTLDLSNGKKKSL